MIVSIALKMLVAVAIVASCFLCCLPVLIVHRCKEQDRSTLAGEKCSMGVWAGAELRTFLLVRTPVRRRSPGEKKRASLLERRGEVEEATTTAESMVEALC